MAEHPKRFSSSRTPDGSPCTSLRNRGNNLLLRQSFKIYLLLQIGWLMVRKHPDVKEKGSKIDLSDLHNDPVVMFQHRHYLPLALTLSIVIPTLIPVRIPLLDSNFVNIVSHTHSMICRGHLGIFFILLLGTNRPIYS